MSSINEGLIQPGPMLSSVELQKLSDKEPITVAVSNNENYAEQPLENRIGNSNPDVVLVDYEENDPENPLNLPSMQKWLIVFAVSWMGFVR